MKSVRWQIPGKVVTVVKDVSNSATNDVQKKKAAENIPAQVVQDIK